MFPRRNSSVRNLLQRTPLLIQQDTGTFLRHQNRLWFSLYSQRQRRYRSFRYRRPLIPEVNSNSQQHDKYCRVSREINQTSSLLLSLRLPNQRYIPDKIPFVLFFRQSGKTFRWIKAGNSVIIGLMSGRRVQPRIQLLLFLSGQLFHQTTPN